jgi:hypothetical protein
MLKFATGIAGVRVFLQDLIDSQSKKERTNSPFYARYSYSFTKPPGNDLSMN